MPCQAVNKGCFSPVHLLSHVQLFAAPWTEARQASLSITNSQSLLKLKSIESVMPSNHLILCCPLLLPPSIFPRKRVFSNESVLRIRWPKYEYSGLISFRIDWFDLLTVHAWHLVKAHGELVIILWSSKIEITVHISLWEMEAQRGLECASKSGHQWDFPGSPVVKTPRFHCRGCGFDPWLGNKDPACHVEEKKKKKIRASVSEFCCSWSQANPCSLFSGWI